MSANDVFWAIGNGFEWSFSILESLGNKANVVFILVGLFLMGLWISQMVKNKRQAEREGTLE